MCIRDSLVPGIGVCKIQAGLNFETRTAYVALVMRSLAFVITAVLFCAPAPAQSIRRLDGSKILIAEADAFAKKTLDAAHVTLSLIHISCSVIFSCPMRRILRCQGVAGEAANNDPAKAAAGRTTKSRRFIWLSDYQVFSHTRTTGYTVSYTHLLREFGKWDVREGSPGPMGATWVEPLKAWNFALYSRRAAGVTLLLYAEVDLTHPVREIRLNPRANKSGRIWHCWVTAEQAPDARCV